MQAVKGKGVFGEMCRAINIRECCGGGGYVTQNNNKKNGFVRDIRAKIFWKYTNVFFYYDSNSVQKMSENINIKSLSSASTEVM